MSLFICNKCGCVENSNLVDGLGNTREEMLCSECKTGTWHGEFEKRHPGPIEFLISKFSLLGYITPYDHVVKLIKSDVTKCGYDIDPVIYDMIKQTNGNLTKHPLYPIYIKYKDVFNYKAMDKLKSIKDILNPTEEDEKLIREVIMSAMGSGVFQASEESKNRTKIEQ